MRRKTDIYLGVKGWKGVLCMDGYNGYLLYILTVRCTAKQCEEDLSLHRIIDMDNREIWTDDKKYKREDLMEVERIKVEEDEIILRIPFLIKEAAIIWVREAFIVIKKDGTREMREAVNEEWKKIANPGYDSHWFTGGKKVEEWKNEMKTLVEKI